MPGQYLIRNALRIDCITPVAYDRELLCGEFNEKGCMRIRQLIGNILLVFRRKLTLLFVSTADYYTSTSRFLGKLSPNFAKGCCEDSAKCDYLHTSADAETKAWEIHPDHRNKIVKLPVKQIGIANSTTQFDDQSAPPIEHLTDSSFELCFNCSGFSPNEIKFSRFQAY